MTTYFISDIHLSASSKANSKLLLNFLDTITPQADALYILGDLFALWLGDDLNLSYANEICIALKKLSNTVPVYFMRGNRDFLVAQKFCEDAGCTLLNDPTVINLYGKKILLTHGDLLCSADLRYQWFRKFVQNPFIKKVFLYLPKTLRFKLGNWIRNTVTKKTQTNMQIYDVTPEAVNAWINKFTPDLIIHGHTHQADMHQHGITQRIVLGDWNTSSAKILKFNAKEIQLQNLIA